MTEMTETAIVTLPVYRTSGPCTIDDMLLGYAGGDKEWVDKFWELAGSILCNDFSRKSLFFFIGNGHGKTTSLRILETIARSIQHPQVEFRTFYRYWTAGRYEQKQAAFIADGVSSLVLTEEQSEHFVRLQQPYSQYATNIVAVANRRFTRLAASPAVREYIHILPFEVRIPPEKMDSAKVEECIKDCADAALERALDGKKRLVLSGGVYSRSKREIEILEALYSGEVLDQSLRGKVYV